MIRKTFNREGLFLSRDSSLLVIVVDDRMESSDTMRYSSAILIFLLLFVCLLCVPQRMGFLKS